VAALGDVRKMMPKWARLGHKVERIGCIDGLAREEFSNQKRWAARWFGPKTKKKKWVAKFSFLI
jgi:hypothetical protein